MTRKENTLNVTGGQLSSEVLSRNINLAYGVDITEEKVDGVLQIEQKKQEARDEIASDLQRLFGVDISYIFKEGKPWDRFTDVEVYKSIFNKHFGGITQAFIQSISIGGKFYPHKFSKTQQYIQKHIFPIKNGEISIDTSTESLERVLLGQSACIVKLLFLSVQFDSYLPVESNVSHLLVDVDLKYNDYLYSKEGKNTYQVTRIFGDYLDIVLNKTLSDDTRFFTGIPQQEIDDSIKILLLQQFVLDYFKGRSAKLISSKKTDGDFLLLLAYLINTVKGSGFSRTHGHLQKNERGFFNKLHGVQMSARLYNRFKESKLYEEYLGRYRLDPYSVQLIVRIITIYPDIFLSEEGIPFDNILNLTIIAGQDQARHDNISALFQRLAKDEEGSDFEIFHIGAALQLELESLPYMHELTGGDIEWIFFIFTENTEDENGEATISIYDTSILFEINYKELQDIKKLPKEQWDYAFKNKDNLETVLNNTITRSEISGDLLYLPSFFSEYRKEIIAACNSYNIKDSNSSVQQVFARLSRDNIYMNIIEFHRETLFPDTPPTQNELDQLSGLYEGFSDVGNIEDIFTIIESIFALSDHYKNSFLEACSHQNILGDIDINILLEIELFCNYIQEYDLWEDIKVAAELYESDIQSETIELGDETLQERGEGIFGLEIWNQIETYNFSDDTIKALVQLGLILDGYGHQTLAHFFKKNTSAIQGIHTKNPALFIQKLEQCRKVIYIFDSFNVKNLKKPIKIFEFVILGSHSCQDIYLLSTLFKSTVEIHDRYEDFIEALMKFLKSGNMDILHNFLDPPSVEKEIENETSTDNKKTRRKRKTPKNGIIQPEFTDKRSERIYTELQKNIKNSGSFLHIIESVLMSNESYDSKIYGYIIVQVQKRNITLSEDQKFTLCSKFSISQSILTPRDIADIMYMVPNLFFGEDNARLIIAGLTKKINWTKDRFNGEDCAKVFYGLQHIQHIDSASILLEAFLKKIQIKDIAMNAQDIYMSLYGLLFYSDQNAVEEVQKQLFHKVGKLSNIRPVSAIGLKQIYALYGKDIPPKIQQRFTEAAVKLEGGSSGEDMLFKEIYDVYPDAIQGHYIDGFECDIFIKSINTIIEYDGPHHTGLKKKRDRHRDNFLKTKYGVRIIRVSATGQIGRISKNLLQRLEKFGKPQTGTTPLIVRNKIREKMGPILRVSES